MSLRALPPSERAFATLVVLVLTLTLGMGLGLVFTRELKPAGPNQTPAARSRLTAVLEGVMAGNVTPAEVQRFKAWVAAGATQAEFAQVEAVVANNCASCHAQGGQFPRIASFEDLRPLAVEAGPAGLLGLVDAGTLHLLAFPLVFLVAAGGYLRRTTLPRRGLLMGTCALAVLFDAGQWWVRQGRPGMGVLWAAWLASLALLATLVVLVAVVLAELWGPRSGQGPVRNNLG